MLLISLVHRGFYLLIFKLNSVRYVFIQRERVGIQRTRQREGIFFQRVENIPSSIAIEERLNEGNKKSAGTFMRKKRWWLCFYFVMKNNENTENCG